MLRQVSARRGTIRDAILCVVVFLGCFTVACLPARQVAAELPPEIMVDKYLIHAEQLHAAKDYAAAFDVMQKVVALQEEHNLTVPDDFHFKYAQVALSADSMRVALESVTRYLSATGKEGQHYQEALKVMLKAEGNEVMSAEDFYNDVIKAEGTCDGLPAGSKCWMVLTNHPDCFVWNAYLSDGGTATWQGKCSGYLPDGEGTLTWYVLDGERTKVKLQEDTGLFRQGKRHGRWVFRDSEGYVSEGPFVDGRKHGDWSWRKPDGSVWKEGQFVDDKKHGHWVERRERYVSEGQYVDGKMHGQWVTRWNDGIVREYPYVHGKVHGKGVVRFPDGIVGGGLYVDGKQDGQWLEGYYGTNKEKGRYVNGNKDGEWLRYSSGKCYTTFYENGDYKGLNSVKLERCRQAGLIAE